MSASPGLEVSRPSADVAVIEFARPERRNPIDGPVGDLLQQAVRDLESDDAVRAVVVTGRDGVFSAGGDIDRIADLPSTPEARIAADFEHRFAASKLIWDSAKPYIAAIPGPVVGAAFGVAMACDLRIGDSTSMFLAPFSHMGLVPDYGLSWLLPRAIGTSAALEIALLGDRVAADEAYRLGILNRLADDPLRTALSVARHIADRPAYGMRETKRLAHAALDQPFSSGLAQEVAAQAHGFHEPEVQQFIEKYTQSIGSRSKGTRG